MCVDSLDYLVNDIKGVGRPFISALPQRCKPVDTLDLVSDKYEQGVENGS